MNEKRSKNFFSCELKNDLGKDDKELIGSGKYGSVYRSQEGIVKKEIRARCNDRGLKGPYREKIVAILQSLLVLQRVNPHFPLHYGFEYVADPKQFKMDMSYLIEEFDMSLDSCKPNALSDSSKLTWVIVVFQILSAILTYSSVFGICHNDLYPRNILIKQIPSPEMFSYRIYGLHYQFRSDFILSITDFGLCGSDILKNKKCNPEITTTLKGEELPELGFHSLRSAKHVLHYKDLPVFSRDLYTFLKYFIYPNALFSNSPANVSNWCKNMLSNIHKNLEHFVDPEGIHKLFNFAFSNSELKKFDLPLLQSDALDPSANCFELTRNTKTYLLSKATQLINEIEY